MSKKILMKKFNEIKDIPIPVIGKKNCGIVLEELLNTTGGEFNIPDFYDIEIKAAELHPKKEITLFTHPPYGPEIFPMQYLSDKYGYPDHDYKKIKVLKGIANAKRKSRIGLFYYYKLEVNDLDRRIYLNVYNKYFRLIDNSFYWDYDELQEMLERKLKELALFIVKRRIIDDEIYYVYNDLYFYKLKGFATFIDEIKKGNIYITINTGVNKTGYRVGKFVDHGCAFKIKLVNIENLFDISLGLGIKKTQFPE